MTSDIVVVIVICISVVVLGLLSTGHWALNTARRAATLFDVRCGVVRPAVPSLGR